MNDQPLTKFKIENHNNKQAFLLQQKSIKHLYELLLISFNINIFTNLIHTALWMGIFCIKTNFGSNFFWLLQFLMKKGSSFIKNVKSSTMFLSSSQLRHSTMSSTWCLYYLPKLSLIDTFKRLIGRHESRKCCFTSNLSSFAHRHWFYFCHF